MIDFARFWAAPEVFAEDDEPDEPAPGATPEALAAWDAEHGVRLPEPLRTAFQIQDGGDVRNTAIQVHPLAEIVPVDDDFWEWTELDEAEAPDRALVFEWGYANDCGGTILMNFNAGGPTGSPSVYYDFHGEQTSHVAGSIAQFFAEQLASDESPSIRWEEAEAQPDIIARETLTFDYGDAGPATLDQILARVGEGVALFARERTGSGESLTRTVLPLPLRSEMTSIQPLRPAPSATFSLHLYPSEPEGIRWAESTTDDDGRWKNSTGQGAPVFGSFEATDRARLETLRAELLGSEAAAQTRADEDRFAAEVRQLKTMTPQERQAAMLGRLMAMMPADQREALLSGSVDQAVQQVVDAAAADGIPPVLAEAAVAVRRRLAEALQRFGSPPTPPDPEHPG